MDAGEEPSLPSPAALQTLRFAAKLGLRLHRAGTRLVYQCEHRTVSDWVRSRFEATRDELAAFVPDLGGSNDCLVPIRPVARPLANLVCVHPLNGSSFAYHHVAREIPERYGVYGCDALDGLFARRPDASLDAMTDHYARALLRSQLMRLPLALYGGSSGGLVVIEMARKMAAAGSPPALIVLGDTRDPMPTSPVQTHYRLKRLVWNSFIEAFFPEEMWDVAPPVHSFWLLEESARIEHLRDRILSLQRAGDVLAALDPSRIHDYFVTFRGYTNCYGEYVPRPYFGRALFLRASQAPQAATSKMIALLQGEAHVRTIEGVHHSFFSPPVSSVVSAAISSALAECLTA